MQSSNRNTARTHSELDQALETFSTGTPDVQIEPISVLRRPMILAALFTLLCVMTALLFPSIMKGLLLIWGLLFTGLQVSHLHCILHSRRSSKQIPEKIRHQPTKKPYVTIVIPTHNEPPDLVIRTLKSMQYIDYDHYEVIVCDNNTKDSKLWLPVRNYCRKLGRNFRFLHFDGVKGYKAGALNLCRPYFHPRAQWLLVVDADYMVASNILDVLVAECHRHSRLKKSLAFIQLPQAYRDVAKTTSSLYANYQYFFDVIMPAANRHQCALLTGTLSCVNLEALDSIGGWQTFSLTEDAATGLALIREGYAGQYLDEQLGRGLMPACLKDVKKQRHRWAFGNAQTLCCLDLNFMVKIGIKRVWYILLQLTAWWQPYLLPAIVLVSIGLAAPFYPVDRSLMALATVLMLLWLCTSGSVKLLYALTFRKSFGLVTVHCQLAWIESTAWFEALAGCKQQFVKTPKPGGQND